MKEKIILVAFGLLVGLGAAEVALRFIRPAHKGSEFDSLSDLRRAMLRPDKKDGKSTTLSDVVMPHPSDKIIYDLRPGLSTEFIRAHVTTNACGMRDPERSLVKPKGTFRIAVIGDSFTFGWGVEQDESFPARLEQYLNDLYKGNPKIEVLNFGVPGYSTFQEVALYKEKALDFDPDAVMVFFVQNDFGYPFFVRDVVGQGGGLMSSSRFADLAERVLKPGVSADPRVNEEKLKLQGLDPNSALRELSDINRARGIKTFLAINPRKEWLSYLKRLPIVNERDDIVVMNLREGIMESITRNHYETKDLVLSFDPHPTPLRHKLFAKLMMPYFEDVIGVRGK